MKKVLSFVLVLSLVLGSFSMAFAATPAGLSDISTSANKDAIQAAYDLGIVTGNPDGTYLPTKAVNRAEFAAMITRAMAVPASALAGYTATTFKDTDGYQWAVPYLAFCETKGIILGDGQGNVMPGRTITVNEAVTMVLRAVGYTNNSNELIGTWPANYVTLAQNLELYDDVAAATTVDKANAAQILYNALKLTKVVVATDGKTEAAAGGKSLLTGNLGATKTDYVVIDGSYFANTAIDVNKLLGKYGTTYTKTTNGKLLAFDPSSKALYGKMKSGSTSVFVADGVEYNLPSGVTSGSVGIKSITNANTTVTTSSIAALLSAANSGKVTLNVKLSGLNIEYVRSIVAWAASDAKKVATADLNTIADKTLLNGTFVKDDTGAIDNTQFALIGAASLGDIKKDNIVYVYNDLNGKIRQIAVGTKVVSGKVAEKYSGTDPYVVVNGSKYYADAVPSYGTADLPALDSSADLYLDAYGDVFYYKSTGGLVDKYGTVTLYAGEGIDNAKAKIYTSDDTSKTFTFNSLDKVTWTSTSGVSDLPATAASAPALVGYALDANGNIKSINSAVTKFYSSGGAITTYSAILKSDRVLEVKNGTSTSVYYTVDTDVKVFTYTGSNPYTIDVAKVADIKTAVDLSSAGAFSYILDGSTVKAFLVKSTEVKGATDKSYGVLNTITDTMDGTTPIQKLVGFIDNAAVTKNTDAAGVVSDSGELATGAALIFTVNNSGVVTNAIVFPQYTAAGASGYLVNNGAVVSDTNDDRTVLTITSSGIKYTVAANAVVYKMTLNGDGTLDAYAQSSLSNIKVGSQVWLYDTKGTDANGTANLVIFYNK